MTNDSNTLDRPLNTLEAIINAIVPHIDDAGARGDVAELSIMAFVMGRVKEAIEERVVATQARARDKHSKAGHRELLADDRIAEARRVAARFAPDPE